MNIKTVKQEQKRFSTTDYKALGIQYYDSDNLYPQRLIKLVDASGTAGLCVDTYKKFIEGRGILDSILYREKIGQNGETVDQIHSLICSDLSRFGGCAIHVNYNLLGEQVSIAHVPFENARLTIPDANNYVSQIAVFHDWAKEKQTTKLSKENIDYVDRYNTDKAVVLAQITAAGGIEYYKGQILYINLDGAECVYPKPIYDSIITDMSTEIGCANIRYRSARNNFLPAGMLIRKGIPMNDTIESDDQYSHEEDEFTTQFKKFQGDENAAKILDVEIESGEEAPEFVPFEGKNHSIEYRETEKQAQENIGKRFNQPPILRCEAVSQGFSTDVMQDAYDYYNSVTDVERRLLERVYTRIFAGRSATNDYSIIPLQYAVESETKKYEDIKTRSDALLILYEKGLITKNKLLAGIGEPERPDGNIYSYEEKKTPPVVILGVGGTQALQSVLADTNMDQLQKKNTLVIIFGFSEDEATKLTTNGNPN